MDAVSRRLELLKLEGLGFSQAEIVKELSHKIVHVPNVQSTRILRLAKVGSLFCRVLWSQMRFC